jgi:Rap1a immunity proteins
MKVVAAWFVVAVAVLSSGSSFAQPRAFFKDGNALLAGLQASPGSPEHAYATGYVVASAEALNEERGLSFKVCFAAPINATQRQVIDIVRQFLEQSPAARDLPAPWLVAYALQRPFPCEGYAPLPQHVPK